MDNNNIAELGRHKPSVESVISRLGRYQNKIKHISVVIEWNSGESNVYGDDKSVKDWVYDASLFRVHVDQMTDGIGEE